MLHCLLQKLHYLVKGVDSSSCLVLLLMGPEVGQASSSSQTAV